MAWRLNSISRVVPICMVLVVLVCTFKTFQYTDSNYWQESPPINNQYSDDPSGTKIVKFYNQVVPGPGVLVNLRGGIGNQLYQYACSYALAAEKDWPLYVSLKNTDENRKFTKYRREFALDQFHIPQLNVYDQSSQVSQVLRVNDQDFFERNFFPSKSLNPGFIELDYQSFCQSPEYWRNYTDQIQTFFQPSENILRAMTGNVTEILSQIKSTESVAVHVRRGDFLRSEVSKMPISYQRTAIQRMATVLQQRNVLSPVFYVFSDDITYAKKQFKDFERKFQFVYVSHLKTTSLEDFYLMMQCKHIIIPNSTFSWWAAYLNANREKVVIRPKVNPLFFQRFRKGSRERKWYERLHATMYFPQEWIVIDPFSETQGAGL